jgi:hypothetical protein
MALLTPLQPRKRGQAACPEQVKRVEGGICQLLTNSVRIGSDGVRSWVLRFSPFQLLNLKTKDPTPGSFTQPAGVPSLIPFSSSSLKSGVSSFS